MCIKTYLVFKQVPAKEEEFTYLRVLFKNEEKWKEGSEGGLVQHLQRRREN